MNFTEFIKAFFMQTENYFVTEKRLEKLTKVLEKRQLDFTVVLENINDPHNLSAILRSCDAVGIFEVYLIYKNRRDIPHLGEKSSASARKWVKKLLFNSVEDCYAELRKQGKKIFTTHLSSEAKSIYDVDMTQNIAIVFGNEHSGVSEEALEKADGNILIPQVGMIQSLNISVACAVTVYEAFRQRNVAGLYDKRNFDVAAFDSVMKEWTKR